MPPSNPQQIERIRELRDLGYTQREVANELGCDPSNVSQISRRHGIIFSNRRDQNGSNNSQYINGLGRSTIERLTRSLVLSSGRSLFICERCGNFSGEFEQPRHHKDRNRANNIPENIEVICQSCHTKEHNKHRSRTANGRFTS